MSGQEYRNLSKALNPLLAEERKRSLGITIKGGEGQKRTSPVRNLSKTKHFSLEHPVFLEMLITFPVSRHTLPYLGVIQVGGRKTSFHLQGCLPLFFHKVLIYCLGEVDEDSALRLFSP